MPGTTRYSATFDRTYEEEDRLNQAAPPNARRSRSQSWQANSGHDGKLYTPFLGRTPTQRSSSTDNGPAKGPEYIPTRTANTAVKAHNNPFQFVKVGTCPLYKKAEEQLKKAKEVKKEDVLKEEEEEWQTNLDSWKSRRRKMSEDVFRRQEEIKQFELEEQIAQVSQKKTKTFSEMVESRATRGRALSLCLLTSPLEFQNWEFENKTPKNGSCSYTDESEENSTVNSEDEGVSIRGRLGEASKNENGINHRTNGDAHIEQNGSKLTTENGDYNKLTDNVQIKPKESSYADSGLESISSSHRAGDTPDSGSDFSQDSNSSMDCDSPRTGVNVLEEFNSKSSQMSKGQEIAVKLNLLEKGQDFGFTFLGGKDEGQVLIASILEGSKAESSGIHLGDRIITIDGSDVSSKKHIEIAALLQKGREKGQINLCLWRHTKSAENRNGFSANGKHKPNTAENPNAKPYEKSVESENEMYVDDFEELQRQSELLTLNKKSETACTNAQAQTNGNKSPTSCKDPILLKTSIAPKLLISNGAVEEPNKIEQKTISSINTENQKKNVVKVKRVRRKGVSTLNVEPNQIPQEGISANSLFPLSPVTELPSPADETKTMSSTLSCSNTITESNSQNEIADRVSETKSNSSVVQRESSKTTSTIPKATCSKSDIELKSPEKDEVKIIDMSDSTNVLLSSTASKSKEENILSENSQNEKLKSPSTPKKMKIKVKKGTTSENVSATSPKVNELSSSVPIIFASPKTMIQQKDSAESKSSCTIPAKQVNSSDIKNVSISQKKENAIVPETTSIEPASKEVTAQNKVPVTDDTVSDDTKDLTVKVNAKLEVADSSLSSTKSKETKITPPGEDKPKVVTQKKLKSKSKEIIVTLPENTSIKPTSEETVAQNNVPVTGSTASNGTRNQSAKVDTKMEAANLPSSLLKKETIIAGDNKPELAKKVVTKSEENGMILSEATSIVQALEEETAQNKVLVADNTASNDNRNQSMKISTKIELGDVSSLTNNKGKNITPGENKPKLFIQKKVKKSKETSVLSPRITTETKLTSSEDNIPNVCTSRENRQKLSLKIDVTNKSTNSSPPVTNSISPKTPQNEKCILPQKKQNTKHKESSTDPAPSIVIGSSISVPNTSDSVVKNAVKQTQLEQEQNSTIFQKNTPQKSAANNETTPLSPIRGATSKKVSCNSLQAVEATTSSSASNASESSAKSTIKENKPRKEQKPPLLIQEKQAKSSKNETTVVSIQRGNTMEHTAADSLQVAKEVLASSISDASDSSVKNTSEENKFIKEKKVNFTLSRQANNYSC